MLISSLLKTPWSVDPESTIKVTPLLFSESPVPGEKAERAFESDPEAEAEQVANASFQERFLHKRG